MAIAPSLYDSIKYRFKHGDTVQLERVTGFFLVNKRFDIILFLLKGKLMVPNRIEMVNFVHCRRVIIEKTNLQLSPTYDAGVISLINYPPSNINYNPQFPR